MLEKRLEELDLRKIADSGQCFRFTCRGLDAYGVTAGAQHLEIEALGEAQFRLDCTQAEFASVWAPYFDLATDYTAIRRRVDPEDAFLSGAAEYGRGIRILRQDPWEMLCTFILSQRKKIPAIKSAVEALCARYGAPFTSGRAEYRAFPTPERLACASTEELGECALGYRAKYVASAARMAAEGRLDLAALAGAEDAALLEALKEVYGVGDKVAACVMLFGFHRMDAFPKDVWINRALDQRYGDGFPYERYRGDNGVLQQYIFYYQRFLEGQG